MAKNSKRSATLAGALMAILTAMGGGTLTSSANAEDNPRPGKESEIRKLEKDGWTCGKAGFDFVECTKGDEKKWCQPSANKCESVRSEPVRSYRVPKAGGQNEGVAEPKGGGPKALASR